MREINLKVLNLYAGIGGNRKLWKNVEVTAIEWDNRIADIYQGFYPDDLVIRKDAHKFLLENFREYDFIWSSPPCPTHSVLSRALKGYGIIRYPDMKLYEEIILLQYYFDGLYCVENVKSYYKPLIRPVEIDRHYFWANFHITPFRVNRNFNIANKKNDVRSVEQLSRFHKIDLSDDVKNKRLLLRNCVYPPLGQHILNCARKTIQQSLTYYDTRG